MCLLTNNKSFWAFTQKSSKAFLGAFGIRNSLSISMEEKIYDSDTSLLIWKPPEQQYEGTVRQYSPPCSQ